MTSTFKRAIAAGGLLAAGTLFYAAPAAAQATRTWVSGVGDDANPCSRTAPCKTFAGSISKTVAGGEINCIDQGAFGPVTITKAISIICEGVTSGVLHSNTNGIIINAPIGADIYLRGLDINGALNGLNGIRFLAGNSLTVENTTIRGSTGASPNGNGILFTPSTPAKLSVINTTISNNGAGTTGTGIEINPAVNGTARVSISNSRIVNNGANGVRALTANGRVVATIRDSVISGNAQGVIVVAAANEGIVTLTNVDVSGNNGFGILASGAAARAQVSRSTIAGNGTGVSAVTGAAVQSYGDNQLIGNASSGSFTLPNATPN